MGTTNGRIGPWGWVAKMDVLQEISGEMGKTAETALIDCKAAMQSIPVPNQHSGADYLLLDFWVPSVPADRPHTNLKNRMGAVLYREPP